MTKDGELERVLGPLEAEVARAVIGAGGSVTVRAVLDRLNRRREPPLAYTTVMTVMSRLAEKGILTRRPEGRGYVYEAVSADAAGIAVRRLLHDFGDAAVARFAAEARADPALLARLQKLLRER